MRKKGQFDTPLSDSNEARFQQWVKRRSKELGRDVSMDLEDYDLRGHWLSGGWAEKGQGHGPDRFKKPNHPTFSVESVYHGAANPAGGKYAGGVWGEGTFTPSTEMASEEGRLDRLQGYMKQVEPGVKLVYPLVPSHGR